MGSTELIANLFRISQTEEKLKKDKIHNCSKATSTHYEVGNKVRKAIEDMMCSGIYTYAEITKTLNDNGIKISLTSVHRYAQSIGL